MRKTKELAQSLWWSAARAIWWVVHCSCVLLHIECCYICGMPGRLRHGPRLSYHEECFQAEMRRWWL